MARSRFWNCSIEMNENEPPNRSMPPQPAFTDGGTRCHSDSFMMRLRATTEPPVTTPRRWPRCAVGAVALVRVLNSVCSWVSSPAALADSVGSSARARTASGNRRRRGMATP